MKHLKVTHDGEDKNVNHYVTTDENAAAVIADFKEGDMIAIDNHTFRGDETVKDSTTLIRVHRIVEIEIKNR
ncbi:hypothetical protein [Glycomyces algeriensis]|uniref:Uncharacterized protein n=1 Tax=Glycomyces algeriensis TaxID=256037 RepID=A0A9W6G5Q5_9ACTN|nr:hypothetical protein [Glycomyces algeriensis]MDA1368401.1 hypothetical protein [Glycomyces algeriensis]MDR7353207.1 hypothetical protein [Glycomyces algeriensis]GLI40901.1 hypothetical protein GALLR39Z86_07510 [Glycomyces algeriensis]